MSLTPAIHPDRFPVVRPVGSVPLPGTVQLVDLALATSLVLRVGPAEGRLN